MKKKILIGLSFLALFFFHISTGFSQRAETPETQHCGKAVLTCFSGDRNGADPNGPTFVMYDVRDRSTIIPSLSDQSPSFNKIMFPNWKASNTGEVFGVAIDQNEMFYLTATSIYTVDYRGDPALGNTGGEVYQVNPTTGAINLLVRLPNSGQGLGNVCYAHAQNGQDLLFVTNFNDGKIYRIDINNPSAYTTYDPFMPDDPTESFAPVGELLWGIAYHPIENQLYFGRWMQNGGDVPGQNKCTACNSDPNPDADIGLGANEVHSLLLDADGNFIGGSVPQLEITLPLTHQVGGIPSDILISNPVSDIAVSSEGRMLMTEKSMCCPTESGAHSGSVVEYERIAGTWMPVPGKQFIIGAGYNSAGGIDYGYDSFDPMNLDSIPPCDSIIWVTCDVYNLPTLGSVGYYGMVGIPTVGNDYHPNLNSIFIDAVPYSIEEKRFIGDVEIFKCGCPAISCENQSLSIEATPTDLENNNCCYALQYDIDNQNAVAVSISALNGIQLDYDPITDIDPSLKRLGWSPSSVTLGNQAGGILPQGALSDFFTFCLTHRLTSPQQVLIEWKDAEGNILCDETLEFDCPPEPECLYILADSLYCNELGYKYVVTVKNPQGGSFDVGRIKLNLLGPSGMFVDPSHIVDLSSPLLPGEIIELTFCLNTNGQNMAGQEFCFLLTAHDGPAEMLCCAEIEQCHILPECDPCEYVSAEIVSKVRTLPVACCYDLVLTNNWGDSYFTSIETEILTPGVTFSTFSYDWFSPWNANALDNNRHYSWTHGSGFIPSMQNEKLMDFCLQGVTTTDPVQIKISWIAKDTICMDTLTVFCPECMVVVEDNVRCLPDGSYEYDFNFQNLNDSGYPVNAVEIIDMGTGVDIMPDGFIHLTSPNPVPPGGTSETITISIPAGAGPPPGSTDPVEFCFKIALHNIVNDSINIECCYVTHCIELPPCQKIDEPCILQCGRSQQRVVGCETLPPGFNPNDINQLQQMFGLVNILTLSDCPYEIEELPPTVSLEDCGNNTILRQFLVTDLTSGNQIICDQIIIIKATHGYELRFPADIVIDCIEDSPDNFFFNSSLCDAIAVEFEDVVEEPNGAGCFQVSRTYTVLNWCEYTGGAPVIIDRDADCDGQPGDEDIWVLVKSGTTYYDQDNDEANLNPATSPCGNGATGHLDNSQINPSITSTGYWQYTQVITVVDNTAPVVIVQAEEAYCAFDSEKCTGFVQMLFTVEENCPQDNLNIEVFLDRDITDSNQSGGIDIGDFNPDANQNSGVFNVINNFQDFIIEAPSIPIGESHAFLIRVEDFCGNVNEVLVPFAVNDCTVAPPVCVTSLTVNLQRLNPPFDFDQDGDVDPAFGAIFLTDVSASNPTEGCSGPVTYSINREGEIPAINQDGLLVSCDDLGNISIEVHSWNSAGLSDYCSTIVRIADPQGWCPVVSNGDQNAGINLYPNPGSTDVYLNLQPFIGQSAGVSIYNRLGQIVETYQYDEIRQRVERLDVSGLVDGVYFVEISIPGRKKEMKKLVVNK